MTTEEAQKLIKRRVLRVLDEGRSASPETQMLAVHQAVTALCNENAEFEYCVRVQSLSEQDVKERRLRCNVVPVLDRIVIRVQT